MSSLIRGLRKTGAHTTEESPQSDVVVEVVDSFESTLDSGEVVEFYDEEESTIPQPHTLPLPPQRVSRKEGVHKNQGVSTPAPRVHTPAPAKSTKTRFIEYEETPTSTKPKAKLGKKKATRKRPTQFTDRDYEIVTHLDWLGKATLNHIAFMLGVKPKLIQKRLKLLAERGFIYLDTSETMALYSATRKGLLMVGITDKPQGSWARSIYSHRNKINSIHVFFKIGGIRFSEMLREVIHESNRKITDGNRSIEEDNYLLAEQQAVIANKPVSEQTIIEQRVMRRKPRNKAELREMPPVRTSDDGFSAYPNLAYPERLIIRSIGDYGEPQCAVDWHGQMTAILNDPSFPVQVAGQETSPTEEELVAMDSVLSNQLWVFRHWNIDGSFEKRHLPDGILVKPHMRHADGSITGGSWAIEMEESKKKLPEICRTIMQSLDHPLLRGVQYFTDDPAIALLVKKAMPMCAQKLAWNLMQQGIPEAQAKAQAERTIATSVRLAKPPVVNITMLSKTKFWG